MGKNSCRAGTTETYSCHEYRATRILVTKRILVTNIAKRILVTNIAQPNDMKRDTQIIETASYVVYLGTDTFLALLFQEHLLANQDWKSYGRPSAISLHGLTLCICSDGWHVSMQEDYKPGAEFLGTVFRGLRLMQEFSHDDYQNHALLLNDLLHRKAEINPVARDDAIRLSTRREGSKLLVLEAIQCLIATTISQETLDATSFQRLGSALREAMNRFRVRC